MEFNVTLTRSNTISHSFEDDVMDSYDESDEYGTSIFGEITAEDTTIGSILIYEFPNNTSFYDRCDAVSGDCEVIASCICGKSGAILKRYLKDEFEYSNIYILDNITIDKEYRNCGIGSAIIKNLLKMLQYQFGFASTIFLCASDFESAKLYGFDSKEYRAGTTHLIEFYSKLGFRVIKNNVMVLHDTVD